ncbi:serine-arginine protein 55-like isoform X2 [Dendronephthya gigantea]|uniref:serine-arginine protein 55-like isoform X2 n=1 Tax=Dendronephthya gigantea TaxID=151771 RepID=UPI00106B52CC|nr:serine-arginine protein 55-like isoform X2 [Dendronephthya gigantea]
MSRDNDARVFLGRLPYRIRESDIERFFKGYGRIRDINVKTGFAFVAFEDYRDADDAVHDLNNKDLLGERVTVEHAKPDRSRGYRGGGGSSYGGDRRDYGRRDGGNSFRDRYGAPYNTEWRVIVDNLSTRAGWQDLKDYMRQAGEVTFTQCHKDRAGQGVVDFACEEDMKKAIKKLDGTELMGRRLRLSEGRGVSGGGRRRSRSRSPRRLSRSPRRSQSRSPRRSRSQSPRRQSRSPSPNRGSPTGSPRRSASPQNHDDAGI